MIFAKKLLLFHLKWSFGLWQKPEIGFRHLHSDDRTKVGGGRLAQMAWSEEAIDLKEKHNSAISMGV